MFTIAGWIIGLIITAVRWTCRVEWNADIRPRLKAKGTPYVYAILHCHQIGAVLGAEPTTGAMLSRSKDGDLLAPSLKLCGVVPVRGSSAKRGKDKGGRAALEKLIDHVKGGKPAYLAVDGPRGPRNQVRRGIAMLAEATGAAVLVAIPVPRWRLILKGTWDRLQIPVPFTKIDIHFGEPVVQAEGEDLESFRLRIEQALIALEEKHDPEEAALGKVAAQKRRERNAREALEREALAAAPAG